MSFLGRQVQRAGLRDIVEIYAPMPSEAADETEDEGREEKEIGTTRPFLGKPDPAAGYR